MRQSTLRMATLAIGAGVSWLGLIQSLHAQESTVWSVSWARSPIQETVAADGADPNFTLSNQTVRQIIHTSISGSTTRLHLSNLYGTVPLVIQDVHLALSASNQTADTVAGTDTAVTFNGQTSVTIPVGGVVTSDSVNFAVPASSDVAVSVYLPSGTAITNLTAHDFSFERNFYVAGDQSTVQSFSPLGSESRYVFLTGLDVQQPVATGTVVAFGASITDGFDSNFFTNHRWPDVLATRLAAAGLTVGVADEGLPGGGTTGGPGQFGPGAEERYSQDALSQPNVRWIVYSDFPINDLDGNPATPASTEISALQSAISQAHAAGVQFICSTLTPYGGPNTKWSSTGESTRDQYDAFVRTAGNGCDGVFDQDAAIQDPTNTVQIAPPFGAGDGIHPNDVGHQILGNALGIAIFGASANAPLVADGTYTLVVRNSGEGTTPLVIDDPGASATHGTPQQVWTRNGAANQQWQLTNLGNNIVSLINVSSGLALEVTGGSATEGVGVDQNPYTGATSQQWRIVSLGTGWFELLNVNSGQSLDVTAGSTSAGALLVQWPYHGVVWEQWSFVH